MHLLVYFPISIQNNRKYKKNIFLLPIYNKSLYLKYRIITRFVRMEGKMPENVKKTILLVEDEMILALTQRKQLESYGYAVQAVNTGEKAVAAAKTSPEIDLILMDINLGSGIDGTEAAGLILKDHDIPIVFVSSHSEREIVEKTEKITSYGYVVKSSSITVLDASIKMAFKLFKEKEKSALVNNKLEATLHALPDLLFEAGLDGYYYYIHSPHPELLYKPSPDLIGNKIPDVLPENASKAIMSAILEAHEKGISTGKQYELEANSEMRWFEISASRIASYPDRPHFILLCRDITERKEMEESLEKRILLLTSPLENADSISFTDLFNMHDIQQIQDDFANATGVASIITKIDGTPLTAPSNFCRLCSEVIRKSKIGSANCMESDAALGRLNAKEPIIKTCLSGGLWDAGTSISIGGKHIANWLIGQVRDETQTEEKMLEYARIIGVDEQSYIEAFKEVPVMTREKFSQIATTLFRFANQLSTLAYQNVQQARLLTERKKAEEALRESETRLLQAEKIARIGNWELSMDTKTVIASTGAHDIYGMEGEKLLLEHVQSAPLPEYRHILDVALSELVAKGTPYNLEFKIRKANNGKVLDIHSIAYFDLAKNKVYGVLQDITERKVAEGLLSNTIEMFQKVVDSIPQFIAWKDRKSVFLGCNGNYAKLVGLPDTKSIIGKTDWDLPWKKEETEHFLEDDKSVMDMDTPRYHILEAALDVDGNIRILDTNKIPLHDITGNVYGVLVAFEDIAERKENERLLFENKNMLRHILDTIPQSVFWKDMDSKYLGCNRVFAKTVGFDSPEDIIGKSDFEIPSSIMNADHYIADDKYVISTKSAKIHIIEQIGIIDENRIWIDTTKVPLLDERQEVYGILGVFDDFTERKLVEDSLKRSEEQHRALIENSHDIIYTLSVDGIFTFVSPSWTVLLGHQTNEVQGKQFSDFVHPDDVNLCYAGIQKAIETNKRQTVSAYRVRHIDGRWRWHTSSAVPFMDKSGKLMGFEGTSRDITSQKRADTKIKALLAEKELLLKEVHHRMKNSMNTISSLLSLQAQALVDPSAKTALEETRSRVQSMGILYDKLYRSADFSELSVKDYVPTLIDEIISNLPNNKMVKVEKYIEDFSLDAKRLQPLGIIINELLTNIMKYAFNGKESGLIAVSATNIKDHITFSVQDDGNGMPESVSFENSTGFGLQLVQALTQQLEGTIRIERENGTKLIIEFEE